MVKKIIAAVKNVFAKDKTVELFATNKEATLSELGGNYCSDCC